MSLNDPRLSATVIVSTYNQPEWLEKVLVGFEHQSRRDFELIIADDGSGAETSRVIEEFKERADLSLQHVWHEDNGFRKCRILNRAVEASQAPYLIFTDGDCIPPRDFVARHLGSATEWRFLSGSYLKLTLPVSQAITAEDIESGVVFSADWIAALGMKLGLDGLKLRGPGSRFEGLLNAASALKRITWNGHNSSALKKDIEAVNGFDERMGYWGEDREMGLRLMNSGVRPRQLRYSICCVHLNHDRPYAGERADRTGNREILRRTKRDRLRWTDFGIRPGPRAPVAD